MAENSMTEQRAALMQKLHQTNSEIQTAGPVHRRDLQRHARRLVRQLKKIDRGTHSPHI